VPPAQLVSVRDQLPCLAKQPPAGRCQRQALGVMAKEEFAGPDAARVAPRRGDRGWETWRLRAAPVMRRIGDGDE